MFILNASEVRKALPMEGAIAAMKQAFGALSAGQAAVPLRGRLPVDAHQGVTLLMPAYVQADNNEAMAIKVVSIFPNNQKRSIPTIHAAVLVLDAVTGAPQALLEGGALTAIRTGAASGAATDLLARQDCKNAAIFGTGVQGRTQLEAVCTARKIETAWVYDLDTARTQSFIAEMAGKGGIPNDLRAATSPEEAAANADIICAATTSTKPVFPNEAVRPGTHINGVGSYALEMVEIHPKIAGRATVFVDSRPAALEEAGELVAAIQQNLLTPEELTELGTVVNHQISGRTSQGEITFFKSVGVAVQDAMAAQLVIRNAQTMGLGQKVAW